MTGPADLPPNAQQLVGRAIQDLAAARLGRAFIPLALVLLLGIGEMLTGSSGWELAVGAPLAAGAMLAHGLRVVERGFGRPERAWMTLSPVMGVLPLTLGVYVLGWRGLRTVASFAGVSTLVSGAVFAFLGLWVLRTWVRLLELARLADAMILGEESGGNG